MTALKKTQAEKLTALPLGDTPLHQLFAGKTNPRNGHAQDALEELKASILAHGVLSSLVVTADGPDGGYTVVAGSRRLAALQQLAAEGKIASNHPVPCVLFHGRADDAAELALAENVVRLDMHPVDQFRAFAALAEKNIPAADIAARFGVSERIVRQRLALGKASPVLLDAYRNGDLTLEKLAAFCVTDDHKAQEEFFNSNNYYGPADVRRALLQKPATAQDSRVKFVTLAAYEAAGGKTSRDLFLDDENGIYVEDITLLTNLVKNKLEEEAEKLRADGWATVRILAEGEYPYEVQEKENLQHAHAETREYTAEEEAELEKIQQRADKILEENNADSEMELDGTAAEEYEKLETRVEEINDGLYIYPKNVKEQGIALLRIHHSGDLDISYFIPASQKKEKAEKKSAAGGASISGDESDDSGTISDKLIEDLGWHRSAAIAADLAVAPKVALQLLTHSLAEQVLYCGWASPLKIEPQHFSAQRSDLFHLDAAGSVKGWNKLLQDKTHWLDQTPEDEKDLWNWIKEQDTETLLDLLAFCSAMTLVIDRRTPLEGIAADLAATLGTDMTKYFTPDADNLFSRLTKPQLLAALKDMRQTPATADEEKMPKAALVELAARSTKKHPDWLPAPLRLNTSRHSEPQGEESPEKPAAKKDAAKSPDLAERGAVKKAEKELQKIAADSNQPAKKKGKKS